jgi:uncharacterized surface protein with fasciclin (FAS1) repeats
MRTGAVMENRSRFIRPLLARAQVLLVLIVSGISSPADCMEVPSIMEALKEIPSAEIFCQAVRGGEIEGLLRGEGPFTVFVPVEKAFADLPDETFKMLFDPANREELDGLLASHVLWGRIMSTEMKQAGCSAVALNEEILAMREINGSLFVQNARIVKADIRCANGVIHLIDKVILGGD